ncbi:MAG: DegT/DnrJ/EryC1/StrS family aminotransferase [Chloroflexota bacterium]
MTSVTLARPQAAASVPLVDLKEEYAAIKHEIDDAIQAVIAQSAFVRGPFARRFEQEWAHYCGASHAVGCANGTAAIELALEALGVGAGDEVVTTPMTFIATVEAIVHAGATPVLADVDPETGNLSATAAQAALTPRTGAILPVALYGQPADMAAFGRLARAKKLVLVEDAAQAHGASWDGRRTGSDGTADASTFSFYPGKNLGAYGDAGALTAAGAAVADRIGRLADHGRETKYTHDAVGYNARIDGLQAAILSAKLRHLDEWNAARRRHAARYDALLAQLEHAGRLCRVRQAPAGRSSHHLYVIRVARRDDVLATLQSAGIEAGVHYPVPLHLQPALTYLGYRQGQFPAAERLADEALSLPLYPLMSERQQDCVVDALLAALNA